LGDDLGRKGASGPDVLLGRKFRWRPRTGIKIKQLRQDVEHLGL